MKKNTVTICICENAKYPKSILDRKNLIEIVGDVTNKQIISFYAMLIKREEVTIIGNIKSKERRIFFFDILPHGYEKIGIQILAKGKKAFNIDRMTFLEEKYDTIVTILEDEIDTQIRTVGGRPRGSRGRSKLDDHKEQLIEMLKGGRNNVQIANELGTTRQTIFTFIKRHNLSKYRP